MKCCKFALFLIIFFPFFVLADSEYNNLVESYLTEISREELDAQFHFCIQAAPNTQARTACYSLANLEDNYTLAPYGSYEIFLNRKKSKKPGEEDWRLHDKVMNAHAITFLNNEASELLTWVNGSDLFDFAVRYTSIGDVVPKKKVGNHRYFVTHVFINDSTFYIFGEVEIEQNIDGIFYGKKITIDHLSVDSFSNYVINGANIGGIQISNGLFKGQTDKVLHQIIVPVIQAQMMNISPKSTEDNFIEQGLQKSIEHFQAVTKGVKLHIN